MFSHFCFIPKLLYSLFAIIVRALSEFSVVFSCFSVSFQLISHLSYYTIIEHVCSPKLTFFTVSTV